jgi:hypothetical protein
MTTADAGAGVANLNLGATERYSNRQIAQPAVDLLDQELGA